MALGKGEYCSHQLDDVIFVALLRNKWEAPPKIGVEGVPYISDLAKHPPSTRSIDKTIF